MSVRTNSLRKCCTQLYTVPIMQFSSSTDQRNLHHLQQVQLFVNQSNCQILMVISKGRHDSGERDIYNFIVNKSPKGLSDLVNTTWKMQNAPKIANHVWIFCKSTLVIVHVMIIIINVNGVYNVPKRYSKTTA